MNFNPFKKLEESSSPESIRSKFLVILYALGAVVSADAANPNLPSLSTFENFQDMQGKTEQVYTSLYEKMQALHTDTIQFDMMDTIQTTQSNVSDTSETTYNQNHVVEKKHVMLVHKGNAVTITESGDGHKLTLEDTDNDQVVNKIKVENFTTNSKRMNATHTFERDKNAVGGTNTYSSILDLTTLEGKVAFDQTQKKWFKLVSESNDYAAKQLPKTDAPEQANVSVSGF